MKIIKNKQSIKSSINKIGETAKGLYKTYGQGQVQRLTKIGAERFANWNDTISKTLFEKTKAVYDLHKNPNKKAYTKKDQVDELIMNKDSVGYLLYDIQFLVIDKAVCNKRKNFKRIHDEWSEMLSFRNMHALENEFKKLRKICGIFSAETDEDMYEEFVERWVEFLNSLGLDIDTEKQTVITRNNREYFKNGIEFPDGSVCGISSRPWFLNGELYCKGILSDEI